MLDDKALDGTLIGMSFLKRLGEIPGRERHAAARAVGRSLSDRFARGEAIAPDDRFLRRRLRGADRIGCADRRARPLRRRFSSVHGRAPAARPRATSAPTGSSPVMPTAWSIASSGVVRPPPSATTARPMSRVAMPATKPSARRRDRKLHRRLRQIFVAAARRNRRDRRAPPPCGRRPPRRGRCPARRRRARSAFLDWSRQCRPTTSISAASASVTSSSRGSRRRPVRKSTAFATSTALPAAEASGSFMSVISAEVFSAGAVGDLDQARRQLARRRALSP